MRIIFLLTFVGIAVAAPGAKIFVDSPAVQVVRSTNNVNQDGSYAYSFETDDGYTREESGSIVNPGQENSYLAVIGSYRYLDPEGNPVDVHYTANDHGFVPHGSHISEQISNNAKTLSQAAIA